VRIFLLLCAMTVVAGWIALPAEWPVAFNVFGRSVAFTLRAPRPTLSLLGWRWSPQLELKQGLDIQGGMQVVLAADVTAIPEADRQTALDSAREIIARRVDLYGVAEPVIQTSRFNDEYRLLVELPGIEDPGQALQLVGKTAELSFRLESTSSAVATTSAVAFFESFQPTGLTGKDLKRAAVQFDQKTGEPVIGLEFNAAGRELFGKLTTDNVGGTLAIFIDDMPVALPRINTPILDGQAIMTGGFDIASAKQLAIQLNAGALPVPIQVLEQRTIGASLGQSSVRDSVRAGVVGILLVMLFMSVYYGWKGVLASLALVVYAVLTVALYKILGVTLTVPGIAGLLLSIGMAVDSNILIFERMKEELRLGKPFERAMELGFGRAWDSIKDANIATIMTALILINPLNLPFLNSSGLVRGFGVTLLVGVVVSLFTGIVVTRTLLRVFVKE
jgi:preprotein translocase subunit SecD